MAWAQYAVDCHVDVFNDAGKRVGYSLACVYANSQKAGKAGYRDAARRGAANVAKLRRCDVKHVHSVNARCVG